MEPRTIRLGMVKYDARKGEVFVLEGATHWVAASWDGMGTWPLGDPRDTEKEALGDVREAIAAASSVDPQTIVKIQAELKRIGAGGADGISAETTETPDIVRLYDTQETGLYRGQEALDALRAVSVDGDRTGFEEAWNALAQLEAMTIDA